MIRIVQSWDDGVVDDIRLTQLLRQYGAHADFNLVPGVYRGKRSWGWRSQDKDVWRLAVDELVEVYDGFDISAHSMTHPDLTQVDPQTLEYEVRESKHRLEEVFNRPVSGFCYPFNAYNSAVIRAVGEAGYRYARGEGSGGGYPPIHPLEFIPNCHFLATDFQEQYDRAKSAGASVFYFWGHSYELAGEARWADFERKLDKMGNDLQSEWGRIRDLFE